MRLVFKNNSRKNLLPATNIAGTLIISDRGVVAELNASSVTLSLSDNITAGADNGFAVSVNTNSEAIAIEVGEETIAVVDIDPRPKRRALGGIALTVGERDVKVAVRLANEVLLHSRRVEQRDDTPCG